RHFFKQINLLQNGLMQESDPVFVRFVKKILFSHNDWYTNRSLASSVILNVIQNHQFLGYRIEIKLKQYQNQIASITLMFQFLKYVRNAPWSPDVLSKQRAPFSCHLHLLRIGIII